MRKFSVILLFMMAMAGSAQTEVKLNQEQRKKLNTFFSNFSELFFASYKIGELSDEALLQFALGHNYRNRYDKLKKQSAQSAVEVTAAQVDLTTEKYFGVKVKEHKNKVYTIPEASGEASVFSQIGKLTELGNDLFRAEGSIYLGETTDPHGTPAQWKKKGEEANLSGTFIATIKKLPDRYVLIDYTESALPADTKAGDAQGQGK